MMCMHRFFWGIYIEVELLGHRLCLSSTLLDNAKLFSKAFVLIYTPTSGCMRVPMLHFILKT